MIGVWAADDDLDLTYLQNIKDMNVNTLIFLRKENFSINDLGFNFDIIAYTDPTDARLGYNKSNILNTLNNYKDNKSIIGYFVNDDSQTSKFSITNKVCSEIKSFNPKLIPLVNLFHNMSHDLFGMNNPFPTYEEYSEAYLQSYIDIVKPDILCFYAYPIIDGWNRFFENLDVISRKATINQIPFIFVSTNVSSSFSECGGDMCSFMNPNRVTDGQYRFLLFSSLVYGSKGIIYFHCSTFNPEYRVEAIGYPKILHKKLNDNSEILLSLKFKRTYHYSNMPTTGKEGYNCGGTPQYDIIPEYSQWENLKNDYYAKELFNMDFAGLAVNPFYGDIQNMVISFFTDDFGHRYFWVFNKSMTISANITISLKTSFSITDILESKMLGNMSSLNVVLESGEAKLFRIENIEIKGPTNWNNIPKVEI